VIFSHKASKNKIRPSIANVTDAAATQQMGVLLCVRTKVCADVASLPAHNCVRFLLRR
jgi:hypothetical protein